MCKVECRIKERLSTVEQKNRREWNAAGIERENREGAQSKARGETRIGEMETVVLAKKIITAAKRIVDSVFHHNTK